MRFPANSAEIGPWEDRLQAMGVSPAIKFGTDDEQERRNGLPLWVVRVYTEAATPFGSVEGAVIEVKVPCEVEPTPGPVRFSGLGFNTNERGAKAGGGFSLSWSASAVVTGEAAVRPSERAARNGHPPIPEPTAAG